MTILQEYPVKQADLAKESHAITSTNQVLDVYMLHITLHYE